LRQTSFDEGPDKARLRDTPPTRGVAETSRERTTNVDLQWHFVYPADDRIGLLVTHCVICVLLVRPGRPAA
jgi:hypothetical protein